MNEYLVLVKFEDNSFMHGFVTAPSREDAVCSILAGVPVRNYKFITEAHVVEVNEDTMVDIPSLLTLEDWVDDQDNGPPT